MEHGKVFTDGVTVGARLRQLDAKKVDDLAESLARVGLLQPILVWAPDHETCALVAGQHRLAAAIKLGWSEIECIFVSLDEIDRELAEIDENLIRAELTAAQIADHLKRRKELWEARGGKNFPTGFAKETAERTGQTKRNVNLSIARAEAIPDIKAVAGTSLDKGVELDALAKMPEADQRALIDRARNGEAVSARQYVSPDRIAKNEDSKELRLQAMESLAERLAEHVPHEQWPVMLTELEAVGSGARPVIDAFRRLTGPVFDKTGAA